MESARTIRNNGGGGKREIEYNTVKKYNQRGKIREKEMIY